MKMKNENEEQEKGVATNPMFKDWQEDDERGEEKRVIELKLPEIQERDY